MNRRTRHSPQRGLTLTEVAVSLVISTGILTALFAFFIPAVQIFQQLMLVDIQKNDVMSAMDILEKEVSDVTQVYVDPDACWEVCMVNAKNERIYYYWDPSATGQYRNLFRKTEPATSAIACTGGKAFLRNLDTTKTTFAVSGSLLHVNLAAKSDSIKSTNFEMRSTFFPTVKERFTLFTEGFECGTLAAGWVVNTGTNSKWDIDQQAAGSGKYLAVDTQLSPGTNTTTIEIPIDLARISSATLQFSYYNDGTIGIPDSFKVEFYDGAAWQTVFNDDSGQMILTAKVVTADLSGYALNQNNKLKFSGTLKDQGSHWRIDDIAIYTP